MAEPPRNFEHDAQFVESGGLKDWGCFAVFLILLVLVLLFVIIRVLLSPRVGEPLAFWGAAGVVAVTVILLLTFWIRARRIKKKKQEQIWQRALGNDQAR
jgi:hypothetical protein